MVFISGLFTAISAGITAISAWAAASPILAGIAQTAFGIGLKYAISKLFPAKTPSTSSQVETNYGSNIPRSVILGTCGLAGHHIYRNNFGSGGREFHDVYVLSSFRITSVPRVKYNGQWRTLSNPDANGWYAVPNEGTSGDNHDNVRVKIYYGTMDQQADPWLIATSRPAGRWTANHRGAGVAYAIVYSQLHKTGRGLTSPAQLLFEVVGAPLYDWRKDSTAGGAGPQRWADQSTWAYSANTAVQIYNIERGFFNGTQLMVGKGKRPTRLPLAQYTQAANICDEGVGGAFRYRSHMIAKDAPGSNHDANLQPLLEAMCGSWVERVDGEFPLAGAPQAIVATITDDDIRKDAKHRFTAKRKRNELINTVAASYVSPDDFYETKDAATRIDQSALAEDRETLASAIPYGAVTDVKQVDRLADIALRGARYQASEEITIHPRFLDKVKEGLWIDRDSAEYGKRTFQVTSRVLGPHQSESPRDITVTLSEIGNGVFDPTAYATNPPVIIVVPPPDYLSEVKNFTAIPNVVQAEGGGLLPGVSLRWDVVDDITVTGILIEYWPVANATQVFTKTVSSDLTVVQIVEGLTSQTDWRVRTTLIVDNGRSVAPSDPFTFRTSNIPTSDVTVGLGQVKQDVVGRITDLQAAIDAINQRVIELSDGFSLEGAVGFAERKVLRQQVGNAFGEVAEETRIRIEQGQALTQQIQTVTSGVGDANARIASVETALVDGDAALAEAIQTVRAEMGDVLADGYLSITAQTSGDTLSQIELAARAQKGGVAALAALIMRVYLEGGVLKTENIHVANRTIFVDENGQNGQAIAVFGENGLTLGIANIGTVNAGLIQSPNGKMAINVNAGTMVIRS